MDTRMHKWFLVGTAALSAVGASTFGATVNLTTAGTSGTINGARFETFDLRPAGTGTINSFLRLQSNSGTEQGYNTSGRPVRFDENTSPNFTRDLRLSDLVSRTVDGTDYYEFILDTNEPNGNGQANVSLDQLNLYTSATGAKTTSTVSSLGDLRYSLDAGGNNNIMITDLNSGSGQADVRILVPTSAFSGAANSDFVYLFARFGDASAAQGGFEEFAVMNNLAVIPLPTASGLAMLGLVIVGARRRR